MFYLIVRLICGISNDKCRIVNIIKDGEDIMALFPIREADILLLAEQITSGLNTNPQMFPLPPVDTGQLSDTIKAVSDSKSNAAQALSAYKSALKAKDELVEKLVGMMKKDLRYAEDITDFNDEKLKQLGWSARKKRGKLKLPGQCIELKIDYQSNGVVILKWEKPVDGGKVQYYEVSRNVGGKGWEPAGSSAFNQMTLTDQPAKVNIEYVVAAVNKRGTGKESNIAEMGS
jgi:hypothetical protein